MNVEFHDSFGDDIIEGIRYYREREPGLETDFSLDVEETVEKVKKDPAAYARRLAEVRGLHLDRFKKYLIRYRYIQESDTVRFLCLIHESRHPRTARERR
jgi:hypothetical protein